MQFRLYNKVRDQIESGNGFFISGDGKQIVKKTFDGGEQRYLDFTERYELSFKSPKLDRNGSPVYEGDILKRVRDKAAEFDREYYEQKDIDETVNDRSGAYGLVVFDGMGFSVKLLEGDKWAFHGPEGAFTFDWEEEVEVVGDKWREDMTKFERGPNPT